MLVRKFGGGLAVGFLDWLGRGSRRDAPDDIVKVVASKLMKFFESDEEQNATYPEPLRNMIQAGAAVDKLPDASGEFGRDASNPIPVNGSLGEVVYLSTLRTSDGLPIVAHRVATANRIDAYEVFAIGSGDWDLLYFDPYHPRKSKLTPDGFTRQRTMFFAAINQRVENFPAGIEAPLREFTGKVLGNGALIPDQIKAPNIHRFPEVISATRPRSFQIATRRFAESQTSPDVEDGAPFVHEASSLLVDLYRGRRTWSDLSPYETELARHMLQYLESRGEGAALVSHVIQGRMSLADLSTERRNQIESFIGGLEAETGDA
jgi:hypothetical protein